MAEISGFLRQTVMGSKPSTLEIERMDVLKMSGTQEKVFKLFPALIMAMLIYFGYVSVENSRHV